MKRLVLVTMLAAASILSFGTPTAVHAQQPSELTIPITGTGAGGSFVGTFTLQRFVATDEGVAAVGRLTGTLTRTSGEVTSIVRTIVLPTLIGDATCEILHLELGPLDLNLLGLQINLSRIVLDITAESGPGNLLGNLLCAIAGLLDNPSGLARLLNQILSIIG